MFAYTSALVGFAARLTDGQVTRLRAVPGVEAVGRTGPRRKPGRADGGGRRRGVRAWPSAAGPATALPSGCGRRAPRSPRMSSTPIHRLRARRVRQAGNLKVRRGGGRARDGADCNGHGARRRVPSAAAPPPGSPGPRSAEGLGAGAGLRRPRVGGHGGRRDELGGGPCDASPRSPTCRPAALRRRGRPRSGLAAAGVFPVVAAGNSDEEQVSPAGAPGAFTVAATDESDRKASFAQLGRLRGHQRPGDGDHLRGHGRRSGRMSGTSMAAPHPRGGGALQGHVRGRRHLPRLLAARQRHPRCPRGRPNRHPAAAGVHIRTLTRVWRGWGRGVSYSARLASGRVRYGRLPGLLGRVPMLHASRRGTGSESTVLVAPIRPPGQHWGGRTGNLPGSVSGVLRPGTPVVRISHASIPGAGPLRHAEI